MHIPSIVSKLLKEPLFHFLLIGMGLFFLYAQLNRDEEANETQQIIINGSTLSVLSTTFMEENGRVPTDKEMMTLVQDDIREEVLYREAIAIGLDQDDLIIRHRLAQKMKYLFEDVTIVDEPNEEELKAYLQENPEIFMNASGLIPKYSEIEEELTSAWIEKEQKKENEDFYENLKSRYDIIIEDEVRKELNASAQQSSVPQ
jgi:hypothetical protein